MKAIGYTWTRDGDLAYLKESWSDHARTYNKRSVLATLENVKSRRSDYFTQEAYDRQVGMYAEGVALFNQ